MSYRKKLIEVSLPLDAINAASAREKQIKVGKPASLHNYWAPRPLATCRAVLFAQLVDDPSSCLEEFPTVEQQARERDRLHGIIEAMVPWEASMNESILHCARYEIARSVARNGGPALPAEWERQPHAAKVIDYLQKHAPPVHDPFSGGALIPLEAQRLGLRSRGSDLNPVAVLIGKALVEFPPKFAGMRPVNPEAEAHGSWNRAEGLADDVRYYSRWIREKAAARIGHLYPSVQLRTGKEATVIAWLWARTVSSPDPRANGRHVPLVSSFVLSAKKGKEVIARPVVQRDAMDWHFEVDRDPSPDAFRAARAGTKAARGANFVCILTGAAIDEKHVKSEANAGRLGQRLMAVVAEGLRCREYLPPSEAQEALALTLEKPDAPDIDRPLPRNPRWFSPPEYGMPMYRDLFTARQLTTLLTLSDLVAEARSKVYADAANAGRAKDPRRDAAAYADAVATYLAFGVSRVAQTNVALSRWASNIEKIQPAFDRQAVPMAWEFGEANVFGPSTGSFSNAIKHIANALEKWGSEVPGAEIFQGNAADGALQGRSLICTDPPYYDNIGYADLSDFFYVWERKCLLDTFPDLFRRIQTPKEEELIADPYRHGGRARSEEFFLAGMKNALANMKAASDHGPVCIFYAFRQGESSIDEQKSTGWSTFLQAIVDSGLGIDGTWPVRTEHSSRSISLDTNALASSIVLVCRERDTGAEAITRADFLRRLRAEMPSAMEKIREAGVGPTDIQQAAIGPGMGIFTRHSAVLNPDGSAMLVRDALKLVNQVREELASEAQGDYDAPTRFAIDWFIVHGHKPARSGEAITMANALGLGLADLERAGIFRTADGRAELMERGKLKAGWSPRTDRFPTAWEACQHLIRQLEEADGGIDAAAALFAELADLAEPAHQLAFRLYDICNNKGWAAEAQPYNNLIQEWPVIEERARAFAAQPPAQGEMAV